jgi:hypothetical protein
VLSAIKVKDTRRRTKYAQRANRLRDCLSNAAALYQALDSAGKYADDLPPLHGSACNAVLASPPHETPYCGSFSVRKAVINSLSGMPVSVSFLTLTFKQATATRNVVRIREVR